MEKDELQALREIAMLLAILVRRNTLQSTVIQEMGNAGMAPKRIAELLGTSANTVNVALHHARKAKKKRHEK